MATTCLFDLDMTLVDSSAVAADRKEGLWSRVQARLGEVRAFPAMTDGIAPHDLPRLLKKKGVKIGIVTASMSHYAKAVLKAFDVPYDALVAYHDTERHKPDPQPLQRAMGLLGVGPEACVHIGDAPHDAEAGYHAGMLTVGALWAFGSRNDPSRRELCLAAPDIMVLDPALLSRPSELDKVRYIGEAASAGGVPVIHKGFRLTWIEKGIRVNCLGRFFTGGDPRSLTAGWTAEIRNLKDGQGKAELFGAVLAASVNGIVWKPDAIVAVPPKPGQENRFLGLLELAKAAIRHKVDVVPDGMHCLEAVEGYKAMRHDARAQAVKGRYTTKRQWKGNVLLVDDVYTSGSTTTECACALLAHGASEVRVAAFGLTQKRFESKTCPACGRSMRIRTKKSDQSKFWGCSGYPDHCRRTIDIPDVDQ